MRRHIFTGLLIAAWVGLPMVSAAADSVPEKKVWAHYVAWMDPKETSGKAANYYDPPVMDVRENPRRDEIMLAREMGIDGWFVDAVFKKGERTHYDNLRMFHEAAQGTDFMIGYCLDGKTDVDWMSAELIRMLKEFGDSPNYPKHNGRYVVFTYTLWAWTPNEWAEIRERCEKAGCPLYLVANLTFSYKQFNTAQIREYLVAFDAAYNFGLAGLNRVRVDQMNKIEAAICAEMGKEFIPGMHPGYLGGWFGRNPFYLPLRGLDMLHESFLAARETDGMNFHLTSWNDHDETTLAPRVLTGGMRQLVRAYSDTLKGKLPRAAKRDVIFAYPREILPGTMLRIEAMRLPGGEKNGEMTVGGKLLSPDGGEVAELPTRHLTNDYDRTEWLVPTTSLARFPALIPQFVGDDGMMKFPAILHSESWIQNQQTVRETFASRASVSGSFNLKWTNGVLRAALKFSAPTNLKRAVLYCNDRPVGTFRTAKNPPICISLAAAGGRGAKRFGIKTVNGKRFASVDRKGSRTTAAQFFGGENLSFILLTPNGDMPFTPRQLLEAGKLEHGGCSVRPKPDLAVYNSDPILQKNGNLNLRAFTLSPEADSMWFVRFELTDGRVGETPVQWPFASAELLKPAVANVLETPVTLEDTSGASGIPGASAFLTDADDRPVKGQRIVRTDVSPLCRRKFQCRDEISLPNGKPIAVLPHRSWPMGSAHISFELFPKHYSGDKTRSIITKGGWQQGFSFSIQPDGRIMAVWTANETDGKVIIVASEAVKTDVWNKIELFSDGKTAFLRVNGKDSRSVTLPEIRVYGNCNVTIGEAAGDAFEGKFRNLAVSSRPE